MNTMNDMLVCPFAITPESIYYCSRQCALYDEEYNRCCILSLTKTLEETVDPNKATTIKIREA